MLTPNEQGSTLHLSSSGTMQIKVMWQGSGITLDVSAFDTVESIKAEIQKRWHQRQELQILSLIDTPHSSKRVFGLSNDRTQADYQIVEVSIPSILKPFGFSQHTGLVS